MTSSGYAVAEFLNRVTDWAIHQPTLTWCCKSIPYFDGLEITKIHRVQLIIADGNIASERVAQKCGFTYEGTARQAMFQRRMHRDMKLYSQLRDERDTGLPNRLFS